MSRVQYSYPSSIKKVYRLLTRIPSGGILDLFMKTDQTLSQLKRIHGQVAGILDMYQDERECIEIVRQIIAARNSLTKVARDVLSTEASRCSRERRIEDLDAVLAEVFKY